MLVASDQPQLDHAHLLEASPLGRNAHALVLVRLSRLHWLWEPVGAFVTIHARWQHTAQPDFSVSELQGHGANIGARIAPQNCRVLNVFQLRSPFVRWCDEVRRRGPDPRSSGWVPYSGPRGDRQRRPRLADFCTLKFYRATLEREYLPERSKKVPHYGPACPCLYSRSTTTGPEPLRQSATAAAKAALSVSRVSACLALASASAAFE
jgi:hypothetical protein